MAKKIKEIESYIELANDKPQEELKAKGFEIQSLGSFIDIKSNDELICKIKINPYGFQFIETSKIFFEHQGLIFRAVYDIIHESKA